MQDDVYLQIKDLKYWYCLFFNLKKIIINSDYINIIDKYLKWIESVLKSVRMAQNENEIKECLFYYKLNLMVFNNFLNYYILNKKCFK